MNRAAEKKHLDALTDLGFMYERGLKSKVQDIYIIQ